MIAAEAGVSRQTVYNHHGDKENLLVAVVRRTHRARQCRLLRHPRHLPRPSRRSRGRPCQPSPSGSTRNCMCSRDGKFLRKLIQTEGERYPELFAGWREDGPGKTWAALAARFARLAHAGYLDIDDPDAGGAPVPGSDQCRPADARRCSAKGRTKRKLRRSATNAVRTFLRAYGRRTDAPRTHKETAAAPRLASRPANRSTPALYPVYASLKLE